jgi:hypothetical protein
MQYEDDLRGMAKVIQFMRAVSVLFLLTHLYYYCYE